MSLRVRRAGEVDAEALRSIRLEALADSPGAYGTTYDDVVGWDLERWADLLTTNAYFLGEVDGCVRGMAQGGVHDDFPGQTWLFGMFVGADARASGLADALVDAVSAWARQGGAHELHLAVALEMSRAISFYRRRGFVEVGEVRYMKRDPSRQIQTMACRLD
ncbi:MAG TPA: GNAT family N-acetyltransferase [Acidimicrobiales bacterium]|nr:GNAT family N-acetyltransferase [Acidimicrobiales bacterium]